MGPPAELGRPRPELYRLSPQTQGYRRRRDVLEKLAVVEHQLQPMAREREPQLIDKLFGKHVTNAVILD